MRFGSQASSHNSQWNDAGVLQTLRADAGIRHPWFDRAGKFSPAIRDIRITWSRAVRAHLSIFALARWTCGVGAYLVMVELVTAIGVSSWF